MSESGLRALFTTAPPLAALLYVGFYVWRIQKAITSRFEHVLQSQREDIVRLERELDVERKARRADNERCDTQIAELRRLLRRLPDQ